MEKEEVSPPKTVTLQVTPDELVLLCNALNESLECVDEFEFATRLGNESDKARDLLEKLTCIWDSMK
jgi:hypothetical protein